MAWVPGFNIHWAILRDSAPCEAISWYQGADAVFVPLIGARTFD